ncbi:unnamed protein product [Mesocestoides corti]|uniref:Disintegrin domain-containing protein n=1 Tax=Mesocestoides corti TaxID=53468 RepID=A0A0R3UHI3_MESCO|nr:unnamed protein product [Mesocestoides corti]
MDPTRSERESLTIDTCGNGVVDRGEECEPHQHGITVNFQPGGTGSGIVNGSVSSSTGCCDPKTCLADVHAVCVDGACCRGCQLVSRGRLCRPARDQCDLPEFCSGLEPNCPSDLYLENGMPCRVDAKTSEESTAAASVGAEERENALCYEGRCPTRSSHCKALWGPSARTADEFCYTSLNKNIDSACGEGVICEDENTMCGLLHCRDGTDEPLPVEARSLSFFNLRTQHDRQKIQCQYVASTQKFSYVPEGASCDVGRFCFQRRCIKPTAIAVHSKCPRGPYIPAGNEEGGGEFIHPAVRRNLPTTPVNATCSGRGICTNGAFCLCPPGWHGPSCSQRQMQPKVMNQNVSSAKSRTPAAFSSVYPDEDISRLIWMYLQAVDKNPGKHSTLHSHASTQLVRCSAYIKHSKAVKTLRLKARASTICLC